ncbi:2-C-methyl-D-erythritol 2,4-cyclodiphosphate synthase [Candidatus Soleaferrea massiliensis]|uniref:2-C-methyl-D-erythritol 2,4-cyclodiphosphate synthase n=1 Tax=Candidatus Soleaferrea massiliensis TaxID=1470354 RepID=UPI00058FF59E|nr:2-C-methyl-D-erythritol 2,4-cyclodiphosphate synthase [Candidatus Soleaferrea massiliensis]
MRIGHGYDVHRLAEDRKLILGGVEVAYEYGLLGHSDADVLTHALMDAVIGAMGLGDIGKWFPDTDESFRGADSMKLLESVAETMERRGCKLGNADCTVIAQRPKLAPYLDEMKKNLSAVLHCEPERINIKATTEENLGFTGAGEGISAHAVVLLMED